MKRPPKIIVILLNWNGGKDTRECLASLQKATYRRFTPIVIDNGSTDQSVSEIRREFPHVPIFETKANLGFAGGNNVGIEWALRKGADWILLLNNDTTVAPDFLERMMDAASEKPQAKILGAKIYRYHDPQRLDHLGGYWNPQILEFDVPANGVVDDGVSYELMEPVDYVCGAALLMHRSVPEAIGLLEPRFFLFWEESDFCFRAVRAGFEVWTAPKAKIWHKVSSSFTGGKPHSHYFWWRSRLLWLERNFTFSERREMYRKIIVPELWKEARHFVLRSLQNGLTRLAFRKPDAKHLQKTARLRAGLFGAFHYAINRFGNCPQFIGRKKIVL